MMYYKAIESGYITAIGTGIVGEEITESEYNAIMRKIQSKLTDPDEYVYKLRADNLEWELVELPPVEEPELTADEALDIILGGGTE